MATVWQTKAAALMESFARRVFSAYELNAILDQYRSDLEAPISLTLPRFAKYLERIGRLRSEFVYRIPTDYVKVASQELGFDAIPPLHAGSRGIHRYVWEQASEYEIALSLRPGSYLSHATAIFMHALTEQIPRTIYVNKEQSPKPAPGGKLNQSAIDRAFNSNQRVSNYHFIHENTRIVLLSGKNTKNLETTEVADNNGVPLRVTGLERTLIDIAVRPVYAGGVHEVLKAYRGARDRVSVPTLVATLRKLGYVYPYHQAIGFYMERAEFPRTSLDRVDRMPKKFRFYLGNKIASPKLDERWQVFYPGELD